MPEATDDVLGQARRLWAGATAVVTGAGSGLGAGFAEVAAELGMSVVVADVDSSRVEQTTARILAAGGHARAEVVDVTDYAEMERLAASAFQGGAHVGLLVNNAGVEHMGLVWETPPEAWHRVVDVNLSGVYHGVRAFVPRMLEASRPAVVLNIASVAALTTGAYHAVYEVTKHGVLALSEALADGLKTTGGTVRAAVALPGPVRTQIYVDANPGLGPDQDLAGRVDEMRSLLADQGMAPDEGARIVLAQVAAGAFAVSTHPDWLASMSEARARRIARMGGPTEGGAGG